MDRSEFDALEIEANGMTTPGEKAERNAEKARVDYREQVEELFRDFENQNLGAFYPGYRPINTTR